MSYVIRPHFDGQPVVLVAPETFSPELKGVLAHEGVSLIASPTCPPGKAYVFPHGVPHWHNPDEKEIDDAGHENDQEGGPEA